MQLYIFASLLSFCAGQVNPSSVQGVASEVTSAFGNLKVRIHTPIQSPEQILTELDSLLAIYTAEAKADQQELNDAVQLEMKRTKNSINHLVLSSFSGLWASIPNPIAATVRSAMAT